MLKQFVKKASVLEKLLVGLMILLLLICLVPRREGFKNKNKEFETHGNDDIYDDFYADVYDNLLHSKKKNKYEVNQIIDVLDLEDDCDILDLGSGTGHQVELFNKNGFNCVGVDKSNAMVKKSKKNYPQNDYRVADFMNSSLYKPNSYDVITCFYFTIYYVEDKNTFLKNCLNWLRPGGYLVLHLVDRTKFDPIIPPSNPLLIVNAQKYAKKRITNSTVHFNRFRYDADFDLKEDDDLAIFKEKFKFKKENKVRENEHRFFMEKHENIVALAKKSGFILNEKIDLMLTQYENQYLYVLKKPTHD